MGVDRVIRLPHAREFQYVTPSGAHVFEQCQLQAAYSSDPDFRREIPSSPAARLGTAAHRVLEAAGGGELPSPDGSEWAEAFEAAWRDAVEREYAASAASPLEASWPIPERWPDYARRKVRTRRLAERLARDACLPVQRSRASSAEGSDTREQLQAAFDGRLRGRADVIKRGSETVIEDYKTGALHDADGAVKPAYRIQMLLYAVLERAASGDWPSTARLIPLAGQPEDVTIEPAEGQAAAEAALAALDSYNARIRAGQSVLSLADPSPDHCRWCPFSVRCPAFWDAAKPSWRDVGITAAAGTVVGSEGSRFGTFDLSVDVEAGTLAPGQAILRGLDTLQFASAAAAQEGSSFAASGLRPGISRVLRAGGPTRVVVES